MKYWLESLQENAFDVFTVVYITVLIIGYHYLNRWKRENDKKEMKHLMLEICDEVVK